MSQEDVDFLISRISNFNSRNPIEKRNILSDMKEKMDAIKDFIPAEDKALYDTLIEKLTPSQTVCEKGSTAGTGKTATVSVKGDPAQAPVTGIT